MPIIGLALHFLIALFFAVHALRNGRQMVWLLILFSFPLLGSLAYFVAEYLPASRLERQGRIAGRALQKSIDPGRDVRDARRVFDLTPTAHNQMRLAAALLDAGQSDEAVQHYDACLGGPFAGDPEVALGAARANAAHGRPAAAIALLVSLQDRQPGFRADDVGLALGRAYAANNQQNEAGVQFEALVERFGSVEARVELVLWAIANGSDDVAQRELKEIVHARKHMGKHTRDLHRELFRRLDAAIAAKQPVV
ncbi:tetratricopeptide repeat protein [Massilia aurea]|uniref:tetratricopeptide repeat protein n=1 Tax=Massilia aurea TaxID=373040 RepID=UPI0034627B21